MPPKKPADDPVKKSNKFRLVVFEGDFSDGSISEIAQSLSSALRPTAPSFVRQMQNGKPSAQLPQGGAEENVGAEEEDIVVDPSDDQAPIETEARAKAPRVSRPKVFKNPDWVELDWNGTGSPPVSLKEFAKEKSPKSRARKYLVAAYWLKEHANHPNVNIDQMYSCFKTAGWSVGFSDWRKTFDNLAYSKHMRKVVAGEFTITTLGEGLLQEPEA